MKNVYEWHGDYMKRSPVILHYNSRHLKNAAGNLHENVEFQLFKSGEGTVYCDERTVTALTGDLVCINSHVLHRTDCTPGSCYDCLIVDADFCRRNGIDTTLIEFTEKFHCDDKTRALFNAITDAYFSKSLYKNVALRGAVLSFISHLAENHSVTGAVIPHPESISLSVSYMKRHLDAPISLDDLARESGLSRWHFAHRFKAVTGYPPLTYLTMLRMERACALLNESERSIAEVALACGFDSSSYFTRTFKGIIGVLPSEYRAGR